MATMLVRIQVEPGRVAEFEDVARGVAEASWRDEPGLVRYEYWRTQTPNSYCVLGTFVSFEAFMEHQLSAHHVAASAAFRGVIASMDFEWVDPVPGANTAPQTVAGPTLNDQAGGRPTESDLARSYRQRFALNVADWWLNPR